MELADQLLGGRYQAVVTTHLNTRHIHNHIVWCAVALDNGRKYHSNAESYYTEVRARSDALCRQYGLSVIETPESEPTEFAASMPNGRRKPDRPADLAQHAIRTGRGRGDRAGR